MRARPIAYTVLAGLLAAAVYAGGYALLRGGRTAPPRVRGTVLVAVDGARVARVRIRVAVPEALEVRLERDKDGRWWQVSPPPPVSASGKVGALLDALPRLTRRATLANGSARPDVLREYGLAEPRARLELGLEDGTTVAVALGDDNGLQGVGFVLAPDGDVTTVPAEALQAVLSAVARLLPEGALPARTPAPFGG